MAESIFEPGLKLGQMIDLKTSFSKLSGKYKVLGVTHSGTISDAVSGKCKTTASLYSFQKNMELVGV
jgi:hypothetical protein